MSDKFYGTLQPLVDQENLQLHYMGFGSFVLRTKSMFRLVTQIPLKNRNFFELSSLSQKVYLV